jgi:hypothetical protein
MPQYICPVCHDLDSTELKVAIQIELSGLLEAHTLTCLRCIVLREAIIGAGFSVEVWTSSSRIFIWHDTPDGCLNVRLRLTSDEEAVADLEVFTLEAVKTPQLAAIGKRTLVPPHGTDSDETFSTIEEWLAECDTQHPNCTLYTQRDTGSRPKRLLSVHAGPGQPITLEEPTNPSIQYACLSHCWGGHQTLRTTTATLENGQKSIA